MMEKNRREEIMIKRSFDSVMFDAMRVIAVPRSGQPAQMSDQLRADAVLFNDAIISLFNVTVKPDDLVKLACHGAFQEFMRAYSEATGYDADKKMAEARAMYTAMETRTIDELTFRFHQMLHYLTTYGVEAVTGRTVAHGWLPNEHNNPAEMTNDETLRPAMPVEVIFGDEKYEYVYRRVLSARNRATDDEQRLLAEAAKHVSADTIRNTPVRFKENLMPVVQTVFFSRTGEERVSVMRAFCGNTNDVFRALKYILDRKHWHLSTSDKRAFVQLLETYPEADFRENLIRSCKVREERLTALRFLDYNRFSRSEAHKQAVSDLRAGTMRSWESRFKKALADHDTDRAVRIVSARPGVAVRYANFMRKQGVSLGDLTAGLAPKAGKLSIATLAENIRTFRETDRPEGPELADFFRGTLSECMKRRITPLKGKKIFFDEKDFDFGVSRPEFNSKAAAGGFCASGLAQKVNFAGARYIRIFVYWESDDQGGRVDIDLHGYAATVSGDRFHIGWNSGFREKGVVFSGDITHSVPYGCEFIDVDLRRKELERVDLTVYSFTRQPFSRIRNCRVGITVLSKAGLGDDVRLYNPKNCLLSQTLDMPCTSLVFGHLDLRNGVLYYGGEQSADDAVCRGRKAPADFTPVVFSLREYLQMLAEAQEAEITDDREAADIVLTAAKASGPKEISLIDENFFADAPEDETKEDAGNPASFSFNAENYCL